MKYDSLDYTFTINPSERKSACVSLFSTISKKSIQSFELQNIFYNFPYEPESNAQICNDHKTFHFYNCPLLSKREKSNNNEINSKYNQNSLSINSNYFNYNDFNSHPLSLLNNGLSNEMSCHINDPFTTPSFSSSSSFINTQTKSILSSHTNDQSSTFTSSSLNQFQYNKINFNQSPNLPFTKSPSSSPIYSSTTSSSISQNLLPRSTNSNRMSFQMVSHQRSQSRVLEPGNPPPKKWWRSNKYKKNSEKSNFQKKSKKNITYSFDENTDGNKKCNYTQTKLDQYHLHT